MESKKSGSCKIPVLGLGTWGMGGWGNPDPSRDQEWVQAIKAALSLGITHIDTAELYGNGHAEELVGQAIEGFPREDLFITTKVKGDNLRSPEVVAACEASLKRLGTPSIDLYLIHWPNPKVPLLETMKAMDRLVEEELVRFIGVSNFSVQQMKEAQHFSKNKIVANQIEYNLLIRNNGEFTDNMESRTIPYCQDNNILVIAYRPLALGKLAKPGIKTLDEVASKYQKTPAQVALNWLISKRNMVTIFKTSSPSHLRENLGALRWQLSPEDLRKLDALKI